MQYQLSAVVLNAFLYKDGTMTDLGLLPGGCNESIAYGINASGQVVGRSGMDALPGSSSNASRTSASGPVAPCSDTGGFPGGAFLYSNGRMADLNSLVNPDSGWILAQANAINDSGQIVGYGANSSGQSDAFLLTPLTAGDANGDGKVDINDLTIVLTNYGKTGRDWWQGDFTGDGIVNVNDLTIVLANFAMKSAAGITAVPEPSAFAILAVCGALPLGLHLAKASGAMTPRRTRGG